MPEPSYSAENIAPRLAQQDMVNARLAERYRQPDVDRRLPFQQRFEQSILQTSQKQAEQVAAIENELKGLGIKTDTGALMEADQYRDFIIKNAAILGVRPGEDLTVKDNFDLFVNEGTKDDPSYLILFNRQIDALRYLMMRGVDVAHLDAGTLSSVMRGQTTKAIERLTGIIWEGRTEAADILMSERGSYVQDLKNDFVRIAGDMAAGKASPEMVGELRQLLEFYALVPDRYSNTERSLIPEFQKLIQAKASLPPQQRKLLNDFFEQEEELVFKAVGEDYFQDILEKRLSFEDAYLEMFGYTVPEIWERRDRNWAEVNKYIMGSIKPRGSLTADDFRQMHTISMKGVVPFFCYGFRSDRNIGWYASEHSKQTVVIGNKKGDQVMTADYKELEANLDRLAVKANKIVGTKQPERLAEIGYGNIFAEYAAIHPHPDGNGTNAVFVVEAMKALRGLTPPEQYDRNYLGRLNKAFNGNPVALALAAAKMKAYEATHIFHEPKTEKTKSSEPEKAPNLRLNVTASPVSM